MCGEWNRVCASLSLPSLEELWPQSVGIVCGSSAAASAFVVIAAERLAERDKCRHCSALDICDAVSSIFLFPAKFAGFFFIFFHLYHTQVPKYSARDSFFFAQIYEPSLWESARRIRAIPSGSTYRVFSRSSVI